MKAQVALQQTRQAVVKSGGEAIEAPAAVMGGVASWPQRRSGRDTPIYNVQPCLQRAADKPDNPGAGRAASAGAAAAGAETELVRGPTAVQSPASAHSRRLPDFRPSACQIAISNRRQTSGPQRLISV